MIKKLSKYGNSLAVLIEKPILELLNIDERTQIRISTDGNKIIIEPINVPGEDSFVSKNSKVQRAHEKITEKYKEAFKKLAKD